MNGSKENAASGAFGKSERREVFFELPTARRMLPLVRRIVKEILETQERLDQLQPEQERLDRDRRSLLWPERSRRYQLRDEAAAAEERLRRAREELGQLGIALIKPKAGWVGFPTIVNGRSAFFSWEPGEEQIDFWHFAGETARRPVPAGWLPSNQPSLAGGN